jgi:hypothetical protein
MKTNRSSFYSSIFVALASFLVTQALAIDVTQYTITTPYFFPLRPGTPEWRSLKSASEVYASCDIPFEIVTQTSTAALVQTCLDYPLQGDIFFSNASPAAGVKALLPKFSGLRELFLRKDAGTYLVTAYQSMVDEALRVNSLPDFVRHGFISNILIQDVILKQLTDTDKVHLARLAFKILRLERTKHGPNAGEALPGRIVIKLFLDEGLNVTVNGQTYNAAYFQDPDWKRYIQSSVDFVPEKPFLDTILTVANQIEDANPLTQ